jgi:hypothetical protein
VPDTLGTRLAAFPQDALPGDEVLDLVYSHQSLLTSTGYNGQPQSFFGVWATSVHDPSNVLILVPGRRRADRPAGRAGREEQPVLNPTLCAGATCSGILFRWPRWLLQGRLSVPGCPP